MFYDDQDNRDLGCKEEKKTERHTTMEWRSYEYEESCAGLIYFLWSTQRYHLAFLLLSSTAVHCNISRWLTGATHLSFTGQSGIGREYLL
jgi:hypothetical protein